MPRLTPVFVTVLALAVLSVPIASTQEEAAKAPKQVVVTAHCPNDGHGPLSVTVNPWTITIKQDDSTRWILNTNRPQDNTIRIEAKEESGWPYPERELSGKDAVTFENMKGNARNDHYFYNITLYCGEDKVVIDPRVRVQ